MLHQRENQVEDDEAVDPVNELTTAYHQLLTEMGPAKSQGVAGEARIPPGVHGASDRSAPQGSRRQDPPHRGAAGREQAPRRLRQEGDVRRLYNEIDALFRTSPIALKKPTPVEEADTILDIFDNTLFTTIPKVYHRFNDWLLGDKAGLDSRSARRSSIREAGSAPTATQPERHRQGQPSGGPQVQRPCDRRP